MLAGAATEPLKDKTLNVCIFCARRLGTQLRFFGLFFGYIVMQVVDSG